MNVILVDIDNLLIHFSILVYKLDLAMSWALEKMSLVNSLAVKEANRFALALLLCQCLWVQAFRHLR